jgi:glycosyltransferase involved in cell wall biosynthesis
MTSGDYSSAEFRARFTGQAKKAAEQSQRIIAVSQFTADQVHSLLGVERSRIHVVHHGVHLPATLAQVRRPVILSVGTLQTRKNTRALVEAFSQLDAPEWRLVLAGGRGYGAEAVDAAIAASPRRGDIQVLGHVTDTQRHQLYAQASVFAFPSLEEGFGIPVLEAMAHGLPVVTANTSSLPEIAGEAALLVDPGDTTALAAALQHLIDDSARREQLAVLGLARAAGFSWSRASEATWEIYRAMLN